MTLYLSNLTARASCDAQVDRLDGGSPGVVKIYQHGGAIPADCDASLGGATLLASITLPNPAFGNASDNNPGGKATLNSLPLAGTASATGTGHFYRACSSDGTAHWQGQCGTSGQQMNLLSTSIVNGMPISITSWDHIQPES